MGKMDIMDQVKAIEGRADGLVKNLKSDLVGVSDYTQTISIIEKFIDDVKDEFGTYVKKVKRSTVNPGKPCPDGEIWCLPIMACATEERCKEHYTDRV